jgi:tRNA(Leu) C34 or U34 (ribose-2'-O)-methylase TrmL
MTPEGRSLNLSIAVGIVAYEAVRQNFQTFKELM